MADSGPLVDGCLAEQMSNEIRAMKIGLLTYHFVDNFGALMQAYALREWFLARGHSAEFIDYRPAYVEHGGPFDRPWKLSLWRKNARILYLKANALRRRAFASRVQVQAFESFRQEHLGVPGPGFTSAAAVSEVSDKFDVLICGSDQIWNPSPQRGLDPIYFLDIPGTERTRKVAYAPSFGRTTIEKRFLPEVGRLVGGLDAVSVREASGLNILEAAGLPRTRARVVPDPTILHGRFDALLGSENTSADHVFCYALRTDEVIRDVAGQVGSLIGSRVRSPQTSHQRWPSIGDAVQVGPVEWLRMLAKARVIVSNSFHGVAMSIVLNKHFLAVSLPGKRAPLNARVLNLLEQLGLSDRMACSTDPASVRQLVETPINWPAVNARVEEVRAAAEAYLNHEIFGVKGQEL
jgi:hypothetical protein